MASWVLLESLEVVIVAAGEGVDVAAGTLDVVTTREEVRECHDERLLAVGISSTVDSPFRLPLRPGFPKLSCLEACEADVLEGSARDEPLSYVDEGA
jgi:hypothetical protein